MGPSDLEALNVVIKRFFLLIQIKIVFNLNWLITFAKVVANLPIGFLPLHDNNALKIINVQLFMYVLQVYHHGSR